jgi:thiamine biosynthesis protein ThiS
MQVIVNGETRILPQPCKLIEALAEWGYQIDMPMAVAVNYKVIHKQAFSHTQLDGNAVIEILMPMQGG